MRASILATVLLATVLIPSGCGGGGSSPSLPPGPTPGGGITVTGTVLGPNDQPYPDAPVVLAGHPLVVTDAAGVFTVTGVAVPYTASVLNGADNEANTYAGLTRSDPTLRSTREVIPEPMALVAGLVSGGAGFPQPANHATKLYVATDHGRGTILTPNTVTGIYNLSPLPWQGAAQTTARMIAYQYEADAAGLPINFTGLGTLDIVVNHLDALIGQNIVMAPLSDTTLSGTVNVPPGYTVFLAGGFAQHSNGMAAVFPPYTSGTSAFSLVVPNVAGVTRGLIATAVGPAGGGSRLYRKNLPAPAVGLVVNMPEIAEALQPGNGATGVGFGTPFLATSVPGVVYQIEFRPNGPGFKLTLHTTSSNFTIPDLSAFGFGLLPSVNYDWSVRALGPYASLDDFVGAGTLLNAPLDEVTLTVSPISSFVTAP